jgi:hypothetical protein
MKFHLVNYDIADRMNRFGVCTYGAGFRGSRKKVTGRYKAKQAPE